MRLLLGRGAEPQDDEMSWRCAIAGGQRTITIEPKGTAGEGPREGSPSLNGSMQLIAMTDEEGLHGDREQLERAGIKPGSRALVKTRLYTEEDRVADGEHTFSCGEVFLAHLGTCPSHAEG